MTDRRSMRHAFLASSVAVRYACRAPYPDAVFELLLRLMAEASRTLLDAGCGSGKIARRLAPLLERVDAVDPSAEMLRFGREQPGGDVANLHWLESDIENAPLDGIYGLIVAGSSVHWFDLPVTLARFAEVLHPNGSLVVLDGDGAMNPPWQDDEYALMLDLGEQRTGVRPQFKPGNPMVDIILDHPQFDACGRQVIKGMFRQSIDNYVRAQQSRASLSRETLGPKLAQEHERRLRTLLAPHAVKGEIEFETCTRIEWGRPLFSADRNNKR